MRRVAPAVALFFVAPLVSEFLLGNLPITLLPALPVLAPMYGGGALLIREVARRTGRGWPSILVLALAYAILEEAFTTQTLFNPDYLHLDMHLLDHAYVPALGMGGAWTVFVLTLHMVWSISVSIALVEALVPDRRETPWLGTPGLTVTAVLFAAGVAITTAITVHGDRFMASIPQFAWSALAVIVLVVAAFRMPQRPVRIDDRTAPAPWLVGVTALAAGSIFLVVPLEWGWWAVTLDLSLEAAMAGTIWWASRRAGWDGRHVLALAGGAALAYAWHAFPQRAVVPAPEWVDLVGNLVFALGLIGLLVAAGRKNRRLEARG